MAGIYGNILLNEINISAEQICHISEQCLAKDQYISEGIDDAIASAIEKLKSFLKKSGNENSIDKVVLSVQSTSNDIVTDIKTNGINKYTLKTISNRLMTMCDDLAKCIDTTNYDSSEIKKYDANKIKNGLILLFIVLMINSILQVTLTLLFGVNIANTILICIIAPLVEEFAKQVSIKGKFAVEFSVLFNSFEVVTYTAQGKAVYGTLKMLKARLKVAGMHITTTILQWFMSNEKIQKALGINPNDKDTASTIGYTLGVLIHGSWNFLAMFSQKFNLMLLK